MYSTVSFGNFKPFNFNTIVGNDAIKRKYASSKFNIRNTTELSCFRVKQLIKSAIEGNEFTQHLDASQVHEIVEAMQEIKFNADEYVITEGNIGDCLYAIQGLL